MTPVRIEARRGAPTARVGQRMLGRGSSFRRDLGGLKRCQDAAAASTCGAQTAFHALADLRSCPSRPARAPRGKVPKPRFRPVRNALTRRLSAFHGPPPISRRRRARCTSETAWAQPASLHARAPAPNAFRADFCEASRASPRAPRGSSAEPEAVTPSPRPASVPPDPRGGSSAAGAPRARVYAETRCRATTSARPAARPRAHQRPRRRGSASRGVMRRPCPALVPRRRVARPHGCLECACRRFCPTL